MTRINVKVADELHEWYTKEARKRALSLNAITIIALEHYRDAREAKEKAN